MPHIYRNGGKRRNLPKFQKEYGKKKGDYVYGAVVGKLYREREAEGVAGGHCPHCHNNLGRCGSHCK